MTRAGAIVFVGLVLSSAQAMAQSSVFLEELTWAEVRDAIQAGKTTVIIPTGGTEQNGPHMVLGKHNFIVRYTAGEIARQLGNALVAPVVTYVPEGSVDPPSGHMRFPGTLTLPQEYFTRILEFAARSFEAHGFLDIALIGDSGGNQAGAESGCRSPQQGMGFDAGPCSSCGGVLQRERTWRLAPAARRDSREYRQSCEHRRHISTARALPRRCASQQTGSWAGERWQRGVRGSDAGQRRVREEGS